MNPHKITLASKIVDQKSIGGNSYRAQFCLYVVYVICFVFDPLKFAVKEDGSMERKKPPEAKSVSI